MKKFILLEIKMDSSSDDKLIKILNSLFKREVKIWMIKQKDTFENLEKSVSTFSEQFRFENKCFFARAEIIVSLINFLKQQDYCVFENNRCYTIFGIFVFENVKIISSSFLHNQENFFSCKDEEIFFKDINLSILKNGTCLF